VRPGRSPSARNAGDVSARKAHLPAYILIRLVILSEVVTDIELVGGADLVVDPQQEL